MREGRGREEWVRTSSLMALVANCAGGKKGGGMFKPSDFDPFAKPEPSGLPITAGSIGMLKSLLPKRERERLKRRGKS